MAVGVVHTLDQKIYWVTYTCIGFLSLIERTKSYDYILSQFARLSKEGYSICGFVIMPNHLHFLIYLPEGGDLNMRIGEMKRFLSYEIVKRLKAIGDSRMLTYLSSIVNVSERRTGKKHRIFISSFDAKICYDRDFVVQKLEYMHGNPVKGKWELAKDYTLYPWSSARYYDMGEETEFCFLVHIVICLIEL